MFVGSDTYIHTINPNKIIQDIDEERDIYHEYYTVLLKKLSEVSSIDGKIDLKERKYNALQYLLK
ncbi:MAG: hypothetical protein ACRC53_01855 [Plesiomonas sp.]|uniref:hypothetical protein n=1 Tax=Plesiomonas sp. TaxID=2486279 RepID=UPI003F38E219